MAVTFEAFDRLNIFALVAAHWHGLRNRHGRESAPDWAARWTLIIAPSTMAGVTIGQGVTMQTPAAVVSALALFSAGLLASFAQLVSIRSRFPTPDDTREDPGTDTRAMLDEAVAHVLFAAVLSAASAFAIVIGMNLRDDGQLPVAMSAAVAFAGTYLLLLFILTARKLYAAYDEANEVSKDAIR